ncbi:MAG TPA: NAD-dependent epimerase/dehydratase family protein [Pyrinomonadaceae bacterium]|jgi:Nucleoside-diphosphate-sugar epimerases|nr:NAD-dependent epimerase/dehydratase family protein [Pyrinomonadaceae bacterium]
MNRVLVVGGNGFIGSHLVNKLAASNLADLIVLDLYPRPYDVLPEGVTFIQGSLVDPSLVRRILIDNDVSVVYHLAWASIHETATRDPIADVEQNLIPSINLLEACRDANVKRVIFVSSGGTVYGLPQSNPVAEDHPTNPINAYGVSKLAVEKYLQMYHHLYGLEYLILRPSVPYGPRQNPHRRQGAVSVFIDHALRGKPITIFGDGNVLRDYFYIEDMSTALASAIDGSLSSNVILNLAGNQGYTLNQLVQTIQETLNLKMEVRYEPARKFDAPQLRLDISAAAKRLHWHPTTPLQQGIKRTADWIQEHII